MPLTSGLYFKKYPLAMQHDSNANTSQDAEFPQLNEGAGSKGFQL